MHNFFYNIFLKIKANKWFSTLFFVLFLGGCLFFANRLKFEEDITRIIPKDEKNDAITKVISQLKFADKVAVIIEKDKAGTIDDMTAQATDFVDSIQTLNQYYNDIQGQYDIDNFASTFDFVHQNLPLFLEKEDYQKLNQKINKNVDIWAYGVITYKILTGKMPFVSGTNSAVSGEGQQYEYTKKIINAELPEDIQLIQEPFKSIILKSLVISPTDRIQSASEIIALLDQYQQYDFENSNSTLHKSNFDPISDSNFSTSTKLKKSEVTQSSDLTSEHQTAENVNVEFNPNPKLKSKTYTSIILMGSILILGSAVFFYWRYQNEKPIDNKANNHSNISNSDKKIKPSQVFQESYKSKLDSIVRMMTKSNLDETMINLDQLAKSISNIDERKLLQNRLNIESNNKGSKLHYLKTKQPNQWNHLITTLQMQN